MYRAFFGIGTVIAFIRRAYLEGFYSVHVKVRYLHDKAYQKGPKWYKKWTDKPYSASVHKTTLVAFVFSFVFFSILQSIFPYLFNPGRPNVVQAGANTVTWDTTAHFTNNGAPSSNYTGASTINGLATANDNLTLSPLYDAGFGTNGVVTSVNSTARKIVTDSENMYVVGDGWRIEKRLLSDGSLVASFGMGGVVTGDATAAAYAAAIDATNLYIVGADASSSQWRIEKRLLSDGSLVAGFGTGGVVLSNPSGSGEWATAVTITATEIYIGGNDAAAGVKQWRIEKRYITTGASASFIVVNPSAYAESIYDITNDGTNLYIVGTRDEVSGVAYWRTEKRAMSNLGLVTGFGTNGVVQTQLSNYSGLKAIVHDGTNIYIGGWINPGVGYDWRVEKRLMSTGALVPEFASSGVLNINPSAGNDELYDMLINSGSLYLTGYDQVTSLNYEWRTEKYSTSNGAIDTSFGASGVVKSNPTTSYDVAHGIAISNNNLYVVGRDSSTARWRIEKYLSSYANPATGSAFKVDAQKVADWGNISWNGSALSSDTSVKFRTRGAATEAGLTSATWDGNAPGSGYITFDVDGHTTDSATINTTSNQWLEIEITLVTDGVATVTVGSFSVTYDTLESPNNANITLSKTGGADTSLYDSSGTQITAGVAGGYTNESAIKLTATGLTCTDCGTSTNIRPEVEVKQTGTAFTGTGTAIADAGNNYAIITGLTAGQSYHIQVRAIDDQGRASGWTSYGGNADPSGVDFTVEHTAPTGTVIIDGGAYTTDTTPNLTISGSDTGGSNLSKMRLSNNGTTWSDWENYVATKASWDLTQYGGDGNEGTKTVYIQFKDNAGNTSGQFLQSTQADFDSGTVSPADTISTTASGNFTLKSPIPPNTVDNGNGTWTTTVIADASDGCIDNGQGGNCPGGIDSTSQTISAPGVVDNDSTPIPGRAYQKFDISGIEGTINSATLNFYVGSIGVSSTPTIDHIPDFGTLDAADYNTAAYNSAIGTYTATAGSKTITVTQYVQQDKTALRTYTAYRYRLSDEANWGQSSSIIASENSTNKPYLSIIWVPTSIEYPASGTLTSSSKDNTAARNYGTINWSASIPSLAGADALRFQVASNDDNATWNFVGPDGTAGTYYTTSGTQIHSSHNGNRYIKYKAYLATADTSVTPVVSDVSIEVNSGISDDITLDTQPPTAFTLTSPATNTWSSGQPSPTFNWGASTGHDKYQLWVDNLLNVDNIASGTTSSSPAAPLAEGNHTWTVKAVDNAGNSTTASATWNYGYDASVPGAITGFTASNNQLSTINLSWNAFSDGGAPLDNYKLERVKESVYVSNGWNLTSNWSAGNGYAIFTLTNASFVDDSGNPAQGQTAIETSVKYVYRITVKDTSNANYSAPQASPVYGLTRDAADPTDPSNVNATACDGTVTYCSDIANKGFEIKLTWNPSVDSGTGMNHYNVYRASSAPDEPSSFTKIAEVNHPTVIFYDNDSVHADPDDRLNDYSTYYYRITAVDSADPANETELLPAFDPSLNTDSGTTPDVTAPSIPGNVTATPMGLDPSGNRQRVTISWNASTDTKARSSANGSGVKEYKLYRATSENGTYSEIATISSPTLTYNNDDLDEFTYFWYKVKAIDNANPGNESAQSSFGTCRTASNAVPTVPTSVSVTSKKGNPNTDAEVGHKATITFSGSYSKNCAGNVRCLVRYEVYRATTNYGTDNEWATSGTKLKLTSAGTRTYNSGATGSDIIPERNDDDRDNSYTIYETNLIDSTTYYYRVRAIDNTPADPDGGPFTSAFSTVQTGTLNAGWDTTPDDTAPQIPVNGLEVKVRDTHPNDVELRNIVTWIMLTGGNVPTRNGSNDFARYEVWREIYNPTNDQLLGTSKVADKTTINENYFTDTVDLTAMIGGLYIKDCKIKYYIVVVDNAGTDFKYANDTVINNTSNISEKEYATDSIIPSKATPSLVGSVVVSNVQVATATVTWTTDQDADSIVQFRPQGSSGEWNIDGQVERTINHTVNLKGMSPNTTYEYQIVSRNYLGNNVQDVGTLPQIRTTGFNITTGSVVTTTSTADISWSTNLNASSAFVEYQLNRQPGDDAQGGTAGVEPGILAASPRNHRVVIKGLRSNRTYTYKIKSISTDGFISETGFLNFKTRNFDSDQFTLAPSSSNVAEKNITATSAQIAWTTGNPTTSWVDFGTRSGVYDYSAGNNDLVQNHWVVLEGLIPGNTYYYRVRVKDANEVEYTSQEYSFRAVLKPKISDLKVSNVTPYTVTIEWITNVETETILNWGKTTAYGEKRGKNEMTKVHKVDVTNLEDNTEYHYQIVATDEVGNEVVDQDKVIRTPLDTEGPKITDVKTDLLPMAGDEETATIIISWKTNKPATTQVLYDEGLIGAKLAKATILDTTLNNTHTVIIRELNPGTTYRYRMVSADKRGNTTTSNDFNFVTPTKEKSILQLILKSLEETFSWVKNVGTFFKGIGSKAK